MAGSTPLLAAGDKRFGKQDTGPWLDVREAFAAPGANPLVTFRETVEAYVAGAGSLVPPPMVPKGYQGAVWLRTDDPAYDVVIVGSRRYMGELLGMSFDRLMAGTQLTWYFEMEAKAPGTAKEPAMVTGPRADGWHGTAPQD